MRLFDRWARLLEEAPQEKVHAPFVQELQQAGFLKVGGRAGARWVGAQPVFAGSLLGEWNGHLLLQPSGCLLLAASPDACFDFAPFPAFPALRTPPAPAAPAG